MGRIALGELGKGEGCQLKTKRAPVLHQQLWQKHDVVPRAVDREGVEAFDRSTMGIDQGYKTLIKHASRVSLADTWGGSHWPLILTLKNTGTRYGECCEVRA